MYVTPDEAQTYVDAVMNPEPWELSTDSLRTRAIKSAQRIIESLNTSGTLVDGEPTDEIKDATILIAIELLDGADPDLDQYNATIKELQFDRLRQTNKSGETPLHIIAGVPSTKAFNILRRYMPDITTVRLGRTS